MIHVEVRPDAELAGLAAADVVAGRIREAAAAGRRFAWAISGGESPAPMVRRLAELDLPWHLVDTWQVDERVAPAGDPDRNRTIAEAELPPGSVDLVRWMPVEDEDLERAAERYADGLPTRFDVVHLGLGPDGHTASLVPDDPVLDERHRTVAVTGSYQGRRRMTLTYAGLALAGRIVWLIDGEEKRAALRKLIARDPSIPGSRVAVADQLVVTDVDVATP
jgi:6-phosphogluconolactonase